MDEVEAAIQRKQRGVDFGLFAVPIARSSDPETSKVAAERVTRTTRLTHAEIAYQCFKAHGPLIANEVKRITGIDGIWKRVSDLKGAGRIRPTGVTRDGQEEFEAVP